MDARYQGPVNRAYTHLVLENDGFLGSKKKVSVCVFACIDAYHKDAHTHKYVCVFV